MISMIYDIKYRQRVVDFLREGHTQNEVKAIFRTSIVAGKNIEKGRVIVMDNARFHRRKELEKLAKDAGCIVLFLPAYSPDLNPIEQFWSWLKRKLREILHNYASLDEAIQTSFQLI